MFNRGWLLFAVVMGVAFQLFQFVRGQTVVFTTLTESRQAADVGAPVSAQEQVPHHYDVQKALEGVPTNELIEGSPNGVPFDATQFNYSSQPVPTNFTLPAPNRTNQSTIVICLSARENFERRAAIRETWAKGNDNVYFIIGGPVPGNTEDMDMEDPLSTSNLLFREQQLFADIIDVIHPDTYRSLPYKLHAGTRWVMKNIESVHWVVKADDDVVVRVKLLQFFVLRKLNPFHPQVIGSVAVGARPHREGKWAEDPKYTAEEYPPWAFGSSGYVVSQPVAQYLADHDDLYYYQGEDAGLGIWLVESPLQVTWVDTPEFRNSEGCLDKLYIIGHDLSIDRIRGCFGELGDKVPERSHIIAFSAGRKDQFPSMINNPNS